MADKEGVEGKGEGEKRAVFLPSRFSPTHPLSTAVYPPVPVSCPPDDPPLGLWGSRSDWLWRVWSIPASDIPGLGFPLCLEGRTAAAQQNTWGGKVTNLRQIRGLVLQSSGPISLAETFPASLFLNETDSLPNHLRELQCWKQDEQSRQVLDAHRYVLPFATAVPDDANW